MIKLSPKPRLLKSVAVTQDMQAQYEILNEKLESNIVIYTPRSIVEATVVQVTIDDIVVDVKAKALGYIAREEFEVKGFGALPAIGDTISVYLNGNMNSDGTLRVSYKKAAQKESMDALLEAQKNQQLVDGLITTKAKGGYNVTLLPSRAEAFLPISQLDITPNKDKAQFNNMQQNEHPYYILNVTNTSIVVSRKKPHNEKNPV